jgi:glutamate--cysteine ligase
MSKPMIAPTDGGLLLRPLSETAIDDVSELFLRASKEPSVWLIGMEIELFGFNKRDLSPFDYQTVSKVLGSIARHWNMSEEHERSGALVGLRGGGAIISLEPGGQLELATRPHPELKDLRRELCGYTDALHAAADEVDGGFWALGYHPFETRDTMPKMPKARYDVMRAWFQRRGGRGLDMMHCTGSVQCAVDYRDEKNMTDKIRTAARVSPFLVALVASSPFSGGKPSGFKSERYQVWLETDDERSGLWPEMLDREGLSFRRYIARAMKAPPFFFMRDGLFRRPADPATPFGHYVEHGFEGTRVTVGDLVDHLTTFFPEIRPKGYVELRSTDCVPPKEAVAIAGFWRAILDDEAVREEVEARLSPMGWAELRALQPLVARLGLSAVSAVGPVSEIAEWLVKLGSERMYGSAADCAECLEPLLVRALAGRSPADEMLEVAEKSSVQEAVMRFAV